MISKGTKKLDTYYERLEKGKVGKIKPKHVKNLIEKLGHRRDKLQKHIEEAHNEAKQVRLGRKLHVLDKQIKRAEWLLEKIEAE